MKQGRSIRRRKGWGGGGGLNSNKGDLDYMQGTSCKLFIFFCHPTPQPVTSLFLRHLSRFIRSREFCDAFVRECLISTSDPKQELCDHVHQEIP